MVNYHRHFLFKATQHQAKHIPCFMTRQEYVKHVATGLSCRHADRPTNCSLLSGMWSRSQVSLHTYLRAQKFKTSAVLS